MSMRLPAIAFLLLAPACADERLDLAMRFMDARPTPEWCTSGQIPTEILASPPGKSTHSQAEAKETTEAICGLFRDALPAPGAIAWSDDGAEIRVRNLKNGEKALALINRGSRPVVIDVVWRELKLRGSPKVLKIFDYDDRGKVHGGFGERVDPGSAILFRISEL